jgi:hypothetical protein
VTGLTEREAALFDGLHDPDRRRGAPLHAGGTFTIPSPSSTSDCAPGLASRLEATGGPLRDRRAERAAAQADTAGLWERAAAHPAAARPEVAQWVESVRRHGTLTRAVPGGAEQRWRVLDAALTVIGSLPADGIELSRWPANSPGTRTRSTAALRPIT